MFKRIITVALLFVLSVSGLFAIDIDAIKNSMPPLNKINIPDIEKITLDNGLRLYLLEDKSLPLVQTMVRIHGGSYLDPQDKIGLAEVCGSLLRTGGTEKWNSDKLNELLEGIGGSAETSISIIAGELRVFMLSSYVDLAMEVMAEILRKPAFEQAKFEQLMVSAKSSIARRNDQPSGIASREFDKLIYGKDSPYARHYEYETLRNISRDDVKAFHHHVFRPENIQMAIWGDIDKKQIIEKVKKYFGDWKKGKEAIPMFPEVSYQYDQQTTYVDIPDVTQSNISLGHIGGRLYDEDHSHRIVMNNIYGLGFGSRLVKEVRSRAGLAYSVYGFYSANLSYPGIFYNYASTKTDSTVKATKLIISEIENIRQIPPTAEELSSAKSRYLNTFVFNFDSKSKVIERLVYYDFFGLPKDFLNKQREQVEKTTANDVIAVAKKYLKPEYLRIIAVGSVKDFDEPLESLNNGKPKSIDISIPK